MDVVETDQAREEFDDIKDINQNTESKIQKINEHETVEKERKCFKCDLKNSNKKDIKLQVFHKPFCKLSNRDNHEKVQHAVVNHQRTTKLQ
ncbi:hypothetical protein TNCV_2004681 [Trichonephila clavipes]|nr:hypothetical protein TNCV_2004681 [Trichonephila clavipes]